MNQKLCKRLKREAVFQIGITPTNYNNNIVIKEITVLNAKGEEKLVKVKRTVRVLGDCLRGYYQRLKRNYNSQYGVTHE